MDSKGNFITAKPQDEVIAKYISYYYFHTSEDSGFSKNFFFYPNYKHAITIYKNSDVLFTDDSSIIKPLSGNNCQTFYSINTHQSFKVVLNGCFDKVGIVFNPLGLNHFIDKPLSEIFNITFGPFDYFGTALDDVALKVFETTSTDEKVQHLDAFFKAKYTGFNEPVLKKALQEVLNCNGAVKVEEISEMLQVNRKTLLRLFKKHVCCSVEEYKKMVMFRNALNYSQQAGNTLSLTDVALYNLYYDQAHFIKHFKSVTKHSPKTLLSKITQLGNQEVYWNFED